MFGIGWIEIERRALAKRCGDQPVRRTSLAEGQTNLGRPEYRDFKFERMSRQRLGWTASILYGRIRLRLKRAASGAAGAWRRHGVRSFDSVLCSIVCSSNRDNVVLACRKRIQQIGYPLQRNADFCPVSRLVVARMKAAADAAMTEECRDDMRRLPEVPRKRRGRPS